MPQHKPPTGLTRQPRSPWTTAKYKFAAWATATIDPVLLIIHLTFICAVALGAANLLLYLVNLFYGDTITEIRFVEELLLGIKFLAPTGAVTAYSLRLLYKLYLQAKLVAAKLKGSEEQP